MAEKGNSLVMYTFTFIMIVNHNKNELIMAVRSRRIFFSPFEKDSNLERNYGRAPSNINLFKLLCNQQFGWLQI